MKTRMCTAALAAALMFQTAVATAEPLRKDYIWARNTNGAAITLDGVLSEPAWAAAESVSIVMQQDTGIPGSGFKFEGGTLPNSPTRATIKFLTVGNQIFMAATVRDTSIGGSELFNRFDGFLMALKDHGQAARPAPSAEYLYSWWWRDDPPAVAQAPGKMPSYKGRWAPDNPMGGPRTAEQIAAWNAATTVVGTTNSDAGHDQSYTVEMKFDLTVMGYDVTDDDGDIVEWNISVYDCDWFWPLTPPFAANRVWWQGPWFNPSTYHHVSIYSKPGITITSGPTPFVYPDINIPNAGSLPLPTIDGSLSEQVWQLAPGIDIRFGDDALRASYPGSGPWRSGQYQPPVNGGTSGVLDPGDATVKWFYQADTLYLGFDVRDVVVQHAATFDRWDGFLVSLNNREIRSGDENLMGRRLSFQVGPTGSAIPQDYLAFLVDSGFAQVAIQLKPGTTVDTVGNDTDAGYTAELKINLRKFDYPAGLGDRSLFLGVNLLDGDSFVPFTDSYGTRTWWQREYETTDGPAWAYLNPDQFVVDVDPVPVTHGRLASLGSYPNPFKLVTTLSYSLPREGQVSLEVFDISGRRVATQDLGRQGAGTQRTMLSGMSWKPGLYLYRLRVVDPATGAVSSATGRMMRLQ